MDRVLEERTSNQKMTLSVYEVARALGIGRNGAYDLVRSGKLRSVRVGARHLVPRAELDRFLEEAAGR